MACAQTLEQTRAALDGECVINSMQSSELATADAALAKAREEATEKNRTYSEAYMRHKRVAQQLRHGLRTPSALDANVRQSVPGDVVRVDHLVGNSIIVYGSQRN